MGEELVMRNLMKLLNLCRESEELLKGEDSLSDIIMHKEEEELTEEELDLVAGGKIFNEVWLKIKRD